MLNPNPAVPEVLSPRLDRRLAFADNAGGTRFQGTVDELVSVDIFSWESEEQLTRLKLT